MVLHPHLEFRQIHVLSRTPRRAESTDVSVDRTSEARCRWDHVIPKAFIAAVIGSEKKTGSTRSTMSPETLRKFRLFSSGTKARRAPLSMPTWSGSASDLTPISLRPAATYASLTRPRAANARRPLRHDPGGGRLPT